MGKGGGEKHGRKDFQQGMGKERGKDKSPEKHVGICTQHSQ